MPTPTFANGHDLVGRYRIGQLLGVGHVAEVYLADDLSLRRPVVIKVLLAHLAAHEDVRRAFRDRIVRAAPLSHPHLERVYDGGQESGHIFMVTEYLGGGTLEAVLASGARLDLEDTARLGRDVAGALAYLHANGFVHGSLSPNSLLFDDEGRVRVTDVTLAGLGGMHGETLTYDEVRYLSPEQALGEVAGEASDVYALALILFEAATGVSPFEAMTPEAMLQSRVTTPLPVRPELGTLDMVLAQAAVPDPRLRLDAEQLANRLSTAAPDDRPLQLAAADEAAPLLARYEPRERGAGIGFRAPSPEAITTSPVGAFPTPARAPRPTRPPRHDPLASLESRRPPRPPNGRRVLLIAAAIVVVLAAVGLGAAWKLGAFKSSHAVPSLTGLTMTQAQATIAGDHAGFTLSETSTAHSSSVPANQIISQSPAAGTQERSGQVIDVVVSSGPTMVAVPAGLVGQDCASATQALLAVHLNAACPTSSEILSSAVAPGRVVRVRLGSRVNPTRVPINSTLLLVLSRGPATTTTTVANTTTTTVVSATTTTSVPAAQLTTVPDVVGLTRAQVFAAMKAADLYFVTVPNTTKWTRATGQSPPAGTKVKKLSTVTVDVK